MIESSGSRRFETAGRNTPISGNRTESPSATGRFVRLHESRNCSKLAQSGLATAILHAENQGMKDITLAGSETCWIVEQSRNSGGLGLGFC